MPLENIKYEKKNSIALVTINRPEKLNALNSRTLTEIMEVFSLAASDPKVRAVILTGSGDRAFVAGADIAELAQLATMEAKRLAERGQEIFNYIDNFQKPVIAAINGFALGGGCELAMACHIRIASENAKFGQPEVKLGLIPGYGGTQRLPRFVGKSRALEMILTGKMIDAEEACRIGLINRVVSFTGFVEIEKDGKKKTVPDLAGTKKALMEEAVKIAEKIIQQAPIATSLALEAVNRGLHLPLKDAQNIEADLFGLTLSTEDSKEGTKAFLDKRQPQWKGR